VKKSVLYGILAVAGLGFASAAQAYNIQARWVFRIGAGVPSDPVAGNTFDATGLATGTAIRFRLQFGCFDDAAGPAPAGGFLGWNIGTLTATGGTNTRTGTSSTPADPRGRLSPFTFAPDPPAEGIPQTDPWMALTSIDATLGTQPLAWNTIQGNPVMPPPPPAVVRGNNTFISVWELTTVIGTNDYSITAAGNVLGATAWNVVQSTPPGAGEDETFGTPDDVPGSILYAPFADAPRPTSSTLNIRVPAPGAFALLGLGGLVAFRRRRS
jgi:MYXO-CTERM domain-containing protein